MTHPPSDPAAEAVSALPSDEAIARILCDAWDYLWDGDPDTDDQVIPENYDGGDRPDKRTFIAGARGIQSKIIAPILADRDRLATELAEARAENARLRDALKRVEASWSGACMGAPNQCNALAEEMVKTARAALNPPAGQGENHG